MGAAVRVQERGRKSWPGYLREQTRVRSLRFLGGEFGKDRGHAGGELGKGMAYPASCSTSKCSILPSSSEVLVLARIVI
jgi:hypothetical protein